MPRHALPAQGLYALLAGNYLTSFAVLDALQARETLALVLSSLNGVALAALFCLYLHGALSRSEPKPA